MVGCLDKFIGIVTQFHEGMRAQVLGNSDASAAFLDSSNVMFNKLELTLFSIMFAVMQSDAFCGHDYTNDRTQILTRFLPR